MIDKPHVDKTNLLNHFFLLFLILMQWSNEMEMCFVYLKNITLLLQLYWHIYAFA